MERYTLVPLLQMIGKEVAAFRRNPDRLRLKMKEAQLRVPYREERKGVGLTGGLEARGRPR